MDRESTVKESRVSKQITLVQTNQYVDNLDICVVFLRGYVAGNVGHFFSWIKLELSNILFKDKNVGRKKIWE